MWRTGIVTKKRAAGWTKARALVLDRANGWCEARISGVCTRIAAHVHHVQRRSQGGTNDLSNLLALCPACHDHIHANPSWAMRAGLLRSGSVRIIGEEAG